MIKRISFLMLALMPTMLWAQFAPAEGIVGTTAMHADSSAFVAWATGCAIERGPMRIDRPASGFASYGEESLALGVPGGTMDVVSLGDGGTATLTFASPICNLPGPDFAVFENGLHPDQDTTMTLYFLELAFVEVSSDGVNFFRFPAVSYVQTETQIGNGGAINPAQLHNFASKYGAMYGTPFDLDEVEDNALLDKNKVTHVRLVDVVGSIDPEYATRDSRGYIVNDPWPTNFYSSGFDLDAVGVIHDLDHFDVPENGEAPVSLYPNPVKDRLTINAENLQSVEVYNAMGQKVMTTASESIDMTSFSKGVYLVRVVCEGGTITKQVLKQ